MESMQNATSDDAVYSTRGVWECWGAKLTTYITLIAVILEVPRWGPRWHQRGQRSLNYVGAMQVVEAKCVEGVGHHTTCRESTAVNTRNTNARATSPARTAHYVERA